MAISALFSALHPSPSADLHRSRRHSPRARPRALSELSLSRDPVPAPWDRARLGLRDSGGGNGAPASAAVCRTELELGEPEPKELGMLYDDGYGEQSVIDYLDAAREMARPDGGPPRWFCPIECGRPVKGAPLLLFLPGTDGVGLGLILHHKSLGKVFEVRCLHIPVNDRTPFEGLQKFVEETVRFEHSFSPNKPIYLVGDSFGGCLALAVAARNPTIDLVLILANPATSFSRSQLQPLFPILEAMPKDLHSAVPFLLAFVMGDPVKMGMASIGKDLPAPQTLDQLSRNLNSMLPRLSVLADIIPKDTLLWKLKLLKSAASYANSRLHAVKAEVLVLASGNDNMIPSKDEADSLWKSLQNCRVRYFKDHGHSLLLEDGFRLLTVIKGTNMYRRSRNYDYVLDFLPPTRTEFNDVFVQGGRWFKEATSPIVLSTLKDGKIVSGLSGVPNEGPVLLVGYHMLLGFEILPLAEAFLREKSILIRGVAHPIIFSKKFESSSQEISHMDHIKAFGAVPVSAKNFYRLFSSKAFVLLYPGGVREALHRKGEEYKLFWPDQPEFVRMAARFGATIVPFGVVGEDDLVEYVLDYNDQMSIPFLRDYIEETNKGLRRLRINAAGEVSSEDLYLPGILPKIPGRFYYLFGKPVETKGRMEVLADRENANEMYSEIKSEVEAVMSYLKRKREEDPYRGILQRTAYRATWGFKHQPPTFEP